MPPDPTVSVGSAQPLALLPSHVDGSLDGMLVLDAGLCVRYANAAGSAILGRPHEAVIGWDFLLRFSPLERRDIGQQLVMSRAGQPGRWSSILSDGERGERAVEYTAQSCVFDGQPALAIVLRDMSEMRRLARKAAALERVAAGMAYAGSLQATLIPACMVMLIDEQQRRLPAAGTYGVPEGYLAALETAWRSGAYMHSIEAYRTQQTLIFRNHHRRLLPDPAYAPMHDLLRAVTWDSGACVPLAYRGRAVGCLVGYYPTAAGPDEGELAFLSAIAGQAAIAVENARLTAAAQAAAALEERHRLARELHDSVSQALYGIGLGVRTAQLQLEREPDQVTASLDYVRDLARTGLAEMRALIFELLPDALEREGLTAAIAKQVTAIQARHGLRITSTLGPEPEVPLEVKEAIYRIALEALNNIVKHAKARAVELYLRADTERVSLEVCDDGMGFDIGGSFPGHLGLHTMRDRATRLGGSLEATSAPGEGTRIHVWIPRPSL